MKKIIFTLMICAPAFVSGVLSDDDDEDAYPVLSSAEKQNDLSNLCHVMGNHSTRIRHITAVKLPKDLCEQRNTLRKQLSEKEILFHEQVNQLYEPRSRLRGQLSKFREQQDDQTISQEETTRIRTEISRIRKEEIAPIKQKASGTKKEIDNIKDQIAQIEREAIARRHCESMREDNAKQVIRQSDSLKKIEANRRAEIQRIAAWHLSDEGIKAQYESSTYGPEFVRFALDKKAQVEKRQIEEEERARRRLNAKPFYQQISRLVLPLPPRQSFPDNDRLYYAPRRLRKDDEVLDPRYIDLRSQHLKTQDVLGKEEKFLRDQLNSEEIGQRARLGGHALELQEELFRDQLKNTQRGRQRALEGHALELEEEALRSQLKNTESYEQRALENNVLNVIKGIIVSTERTERDNIKRAVATEQGKFAIELEETIARDKFMGNQEEELMRAVDNEVQKGKLVREEIAARASLMQQEPRIRFIAERVVRRELKEIQSKSTQNK